MRSIDKIRQKRRFIMFNEKSREKVLELNEFFKKYQMHYEETIKKRFTYYDTPNQDLKKSNIVLYKTTIGNFNELNMANDKVGYTQRFSNMRMRTNFKHFRTEIKPHDSLMKHKELIDNFTSMFMSSIGFDPEFLMRKLQVAYTIETKAVEYRSLNVTGLKITYSFDKDIYTNHTNKNSTEAHILTIYQHSGEQTDEAFDDLISKLTRYCKELTPTNDTKILLARESTQSNRNPINLDKKNGKIQNKKDKKDKKKK